MSNNINVQIDNMNINRTYTKSGVTKHPCPLLISVGQNKKLQGENISFYKKHLKIGCAKHLSQCL